MYQYNGKAAPELLLLNQKGVEALKGLTQINKEPEQIIDGYYELSPVKRSQTLSEKKLEFKQQLESSLALAKDKLYDYSDAEIAQFEKEAETLFTSPAGFKQAA